MLVVGRCDVVAVFNVSMGLAFFIIKHGLRAYWFSMIIIDQLTTTHVSCLNRYVIERAGLFSHAHTAGFYPVSWELA